MDHIKIRTDNLYTNPGIQITASPYVGEDGIYVPMQEYVPEGIHSDYRMIMSKEIFIEAYNKWIKGE